MYEKREWTSLKCNDVVTVALPVSTSLSYVFTVQCNFTTARDKFSSVDERGPYISQRWKTKRENVIEWIECLSICTTQDLYMMC